MGRFLTTLHPRSLERRGEVRRDATRAAWLIACDLAASEFKADVRTVMQGSGKVGRGSHSEAVTVARKVACYLASVTANAAPEQLAQASRFNRATIHKHVAWVEDRRDEPMFDAQIEALERALLLMAARVVMARLGGAEL